MPPPAPAGDRRRKRNREKRLDTIEDSAAAASASASVDKARGGGEAPRRSSRLRKAPKLLDTSPAPRRKRFREVKSGSLGERRSSRKRQRSSRLDFGEDKKDGIGMRLQFRSERLRARANVQASSKETMDDAVGNQRSNKRRPAANEVASEASEYEDINESSFNCSVEVGERESVSEEVNGVSGDDGEDDADVPVSSHSGDESDDNEGLPSNVLVNADAKKIDDEKEDDMDLGGGSEVGLAKKRSRDADSKDVENANCMMVDVDEQIDNVGDLVPQENLHTSPKVGGSDEHVKPQDDEFVDLLDEDACSVKESGSAMLDDKVESVKVKEGRRCGLCGGGVDGRPPKVADSDSAESGNDAYEGPSVSEEPNYDMWDGFGDDPGWLGRLLGPIHDRFGIARVWVHQNCAVWSPEVYFADLGCLKNVRAALCRGRALKCCRCGRPGATIGCRVDRCPKTYHLPCSRAESCIFDHRKFLIACNDHRYLFQPQGEKFQECIRNLKAKKMRKDMRRISRDALRKDMEAEERWLEKCGEDEEFLKREGRRLHRDLQRIAPSYIGGSSENENIFHGWESVAGLHDVIKSLKEVVILPLLYPELFGSLGLTPPRGVLLHGYPGTGKTLVVRALIGACSRGDRKIAYFARKGADCLGKYVGDAERQLRLLFQVAERTQPSIIFFDEIDGLAPCRSRQQDQTHNSVVSTLLSLLDGLKSRGSVIVIGATNRPDAVDPALRRPGRFDREIHFPLPDFESRAAILSLHTKCWSQPLTGSLLSFLAKQTIGYAGADLQALCTLAAMNALKRSCPLQGLLCSAEKDISNGRLPPLPSIVVEERDWLAALVSAPLPCSRREAGTAVNDVCFSALDAHLLPCLLKPLVHILITLCMDGRIWLPSSLLKAATFIKSIVFTALEKMEVPIAAWSSSLESLIRHDDVAKKIKEILSDNGLVTTLSGWDKNSASGDYVNFNVTQPDSGRSISCQSMQKQSAFRTLIAGPPRSGQHFLAGTILHGFTGHVEICKINVATMSQEGNGDVICGLTNILSKCQSFAQCVIYLPRIDLWASTNIEQRSHENISAAKHQNGNFTHGCSKIWNSFVEQIYSTSASVSTTILATSELEFCDLPLGVKQFFDTNVLDQHNTVSRHLIPRFSVTVDGNFSRETVISYGALTLSELLVRRYIQLLHHQYHEISTEKHKEELRSQVSGEGCNMSVLKQPGAETTLVNMTALNTETVVKDGEIEVSRIHNKGQSSASISKVSEDNPKKTEMQFDNNADKIVKDSIKQAISMFGYQILCHRQFAQLCWVTSKLKDGPCADINGPWKDWPFNSCILQDRNSCEKPTAEIHSIKTNALSGSVRGLVAVGILACKGAYMSATEVCNEVRMVLELLVGEIRTKMAEKKKCHRYFHILAQAAYLEDAVNSWGYTYQRKTENVSNPIVNHGTTDLDDHQHKESHDVPEQLIQDNFNNHSSISASQYSVSHAAPALITPSSKPYQLPPKSSGDSLSAMKELMEGDSSNVERTNGMQAEKSALRESDGIAESIELSNDHQRSVNCTHDIQNETIPGSSKVIQTFCCYNCCSECFHLICKSIHESLLSGMKFDIHCSPIEDIHDILTSSSLNLLSALRKWYSSPCSVHQKELVDKESRNNSPEVCFCQIVTDGRGGRNPMEYSSTECTHHSIDSEGVVAAGCDGSSPELSFCFRDGILLPPGPNLDCSYHCCFKRLCLSSVANLLHKVTGMS